MDDSFTPLSAAQQGQYLRCETLVFGAIRRAVPCNVPAIGWVGRSERERQLVCAHHRARILEIQDASRS